MQNPQQNPREGTSILWLLRQLFILLEPYGKNTLKMDDLSASQSYLLYYLLLSEAPQSYASDIHIQLGLSKATLSSNLKALRQRGYIQTGSDPQDDRKKQIRLTEKAHCLKHRLQEVISQKQGCLCQGLSSHQIEILEYCLTKMLLNIKQYSRKE